MRKRAVGVRKRRLVEVSEAMWRLLNDEPARPEDMGERVAVEFYRDTKRTEAWGLCRGDVLAGWTAERPGTRPSAWWDYDAPRWDDPWGGTFYHGTFAVPRERLGGVGTPAFDALDYVPRFEKGLPVGWVTAFDVAYYNGRPPYNEPGRPERYVEGHFPYDAIDPEDPPVYESEATYLARLGLLLPGERELIPWEGWQPVRIGDSGGELDADGGDPTDD